MTVGAVLGKHQCAIGAVFFPGMSAAEEWLRLNKAGGFWLAGLNQLPLPNVIGVDETGKVVVEGYV